MKSHGLYCWLTQTKWLSFLFVVCVFFLFLLFLPISYALSCPAQFVATKQVMDENIVVSVQDTTPNCDFGACWTNYTQATLFADSTCQMQTSSSQQLSADVNNLIVPWQITCDNAQQITKIVLSSNSNNCEIDLTQLDTVNQRNEHIENEDNNEPDVKKKKTTSPSRSIVYTNQTTAIPNNTSLMNTTVSTRIGDEKTPSQTASSQTVSHISTINTTSQKNGVSDSIIVIPYSDISSNARDTQRMIPKQQKSHTQFEDELLAVLIFVAIAVVAIVNVLLLVAILRKKTSRK